MDNFVVRGLEIFKRSRENLVKIRGFLELKLPLCSTLGCLNAQDLPIFH